MFGNSTIRTMGMLIVLATATGILPVTAFAQETQIQGSINTISTQISETGAITSISNTTKMVQGPDAITEAVKGMLLIQGENKSKTIIVNDVNNSTQVLDNYDAANRGILREVNEAINATVSQPTELRRPIIIVGEWIYCGCGGSVHVIDIYY